MKTLVSYRPNKIQNTFSDFDRYFDSFFGNSIFTPTTRSFSHLPAVDARETEKSYILDMELPGYDENDIEIHVDGSNLSISSKQGEPKDLQEAADAKEDKDSVDTGTWIIRERRINSFSRSFKLPENADPGEITAKFKNGILNMEIKKRAEAQKRLIQINK